MKFSGPTWRKLLKWGAYTMAALVLLIVVTVVTLYFVLKSKSWGEDDIAQLSPYLAAAGVELQELDSAQIDLLRHIDIQGLKLAWRDDRSGNLLLNAGKINLRYEFSSLFSDKIKINALEVKDIVLSGNLHVEATEAPPPPPPDGAPAVEELLTRPLRELQVDAIEISNINLDIKLTSGEQRRQVRGSLQTLSMQTSLTAGHWQVQLQAKTKPDDTWRLGWAGAGGQYELSFRLGLDSSVAADLVYAKQQAGWRVDMQQHHRWQIDTMRLIHALDKRTQEMAVLDSFQLNMDLQAKSQASDHTASPQNKPGDLHTIFPLEVESEFASRSQGLRFDHLDMNGLKLDGQAGHDMTWHMRGQFDPQADTPPDFQFDTKQTLWVKDGNLAYGDFHAGLASLQWELSGQSEKASPQAPVRFEVKMQSQGDKVQIAQKPSGGREGWQTRFDIDSDLKASAEVGSLAHLAQQLVSRGEHTLRLKGFEFQYDGQTYAFERQHLANRWHFADDIITTQADMQVDDLSMPHIQGKSFWSQHIELSTDTEWRQPQLRMHAAMDNKPLLEFSIQAQNRPSALSLQHELTLKTFTELRRLDLVKTLWASFPGPHLDWRGEFEVSHGANSMVEADFAAWPSWPLTSKGNLVLQQKTGTKRIIQKPLTVAYTLNKDGDYQITLNARSKALDSGISQKPLPVALQSQWRFPWPLQRVSAKGRIQLQNKNALVYQWQWRDKPRHMNLNADAQINLNENVAAYFPELNVAGEGGVRVKLRGQLNHPHASILEWDGGLKGIQAALDVETNLSQPRDYPHPWIRFGEPAATQHRIQWNSRGGQWQAQFDMPALLIPQHLAAQGIKGDLRIQFEPGLDPKHVALAFNLDKGQLEWLQDKGVEMELGQLVTPLKLELDADLQNQAIELNRFAMNMGSQLVAMDLSGNAGLGGDRARLDGELRVNLRKNIMTRPPLSGSGSIQAPLRFTMIPGGQATLEGGVAFDDVDLQWDAFQWKSVNGRFKLEEELIISDQLAKFRYLVSVDPFQRVDFSQIQPYLDDKQNLQFDTLAWHGLKIGPGLMSMRVKQNVFQLQRLDLQILGGNLNGQMYVNVQPGVWQIGLLSRISGVDLRELLAPQASIQTSYAPVNARTALTFDVYQRLVEGQITVTKINRDQLLQLLEIVDPNHVDEQIALVRSALKFAYPEHVIVDMARGLMDLSVKVSTLPRPMRIIGVPLTPLIQRYGGDWIDTLRQVPLQ